MRICCRPGSADPPLQMTGMLGENLVLPDTITQVRRRQGRAACARRVREIGREGGAQLCPVQAFCGQWPMFCMASFVDADWPLQPSAHVTADVIADWNTACALRPHWHMP